MQQSLSKLENLMQGSIQILDHMKLNDDSTDQKVEQMKQFLQQEYNNIAGLSAFSGDVEQSRQTIASMQKKIKEVESMLEPMKDHFFAKYNQQTAGSPAQFESQPLGQQKEQSGIYHDKIDSKSTEKLLENLNAMNAELLDLSGSIQRQARQASADTMGGTDISIPSEQYDHDPAPGSLSP